MPSKDASVRVVAYAAIECLEFRETISKPEICLKRNALTIKYSFRQYLGAVHTWGLFIVRVIKERTIACPLAVMKLDRGSARKSFLFNGPFHTTIPNNAPNAQR